MGISRQRVFKQGGFTLIELMVAVTIMGILLGLAIPSFVSFVNTNKLASGANEMIASIQTARMESIRRNRRVVVCLSAVPNAATPTCGGAIPTGWITFLDVDRNGAYNPACGTPPCDTLLRASTLKSQVVMLSSTAVGGSVIFRSDGLARDSTGALLNGAVDLCVVTNKPVTNARDVCLGSGSRVSVKSTTNVSCSTAPVFTTACN